MKYRRLFCASAILLVTSLGAQTAKPEWQAGVNNIKTLLKTDVEQAVDAADDLTKGKNKKNIDLLLAVAEVFVDAKHLDEAEEFLEKAKNRDNKDPRVSILAGDIALAREDVGTACQLYEQAIYFDTIITLNIYGTKDRAVMEDCLILCDEFEKKFSKTVEGSDIWKINQASL